MTFDKKLMSLFYHAVMKCLRSLLKLLRLLEWFGFSKLSELIFPLREREKQVRVTTVDSLLELYKAHSFTFVTEDSRSGSLQKSLPSDSTLLVTALLPYSKEVQPLILEAKFHRNAQAAKLLGCVLSQYLLSGGFAKELLALGIHRCILVPIPLGKVRRKERGYNQVEEIARQALGHLLSSQANVILSQTRTTHSIPFILSTNIFKRVRETTPQTSLGRTERLNNMQYAFSTTEPLRNDTLYIVIDDVTTTGATLFAACDALKKAGARHVKAIALTH